MPGAEAHHFRKQNWREGPPFFKSRSMKANPAISARKPAGKRDIILGAAGAIFLTEGYGATSINKIIERVGGSKATVYAHFQNKEHLFEAVVESIVEEVPIFINAVQLDDLDLREGLIAISARLLEIATSPRHLALARIVIAEAERFPEIGRIYYEHTPQHICKVLTAFLAARADSEGLAVARPEELVESYTGMILHHQLFRQFCTDATPPSKMEIRRIAVRNASLLIAMLTSAGEERL